MCILKHPLIFLATILFYFHYYLLCAFFEEILSIKVASRAIKILIYDALKTQPGYQE